jgi:MATE family multidrug resistance protein
MRLGLQMALGLALTCSLLLWLLHLPLARLFAGPNPPVVLLAATLLPWVALYHLFDAVQAVGVFILRSYGVATASLVIYSVLLWGLGLGGGYVPPMPTPSAFWIAASVALGLTAVAVLTLLAWASKRPRPAH